MKFCAATVMAGAMLATTVPSIAHAHTPDRAPLPAGGMTITEPGTYQFTLPHSENPGPAEPVSLEVEVFEQDASPTFANTCGSPGAMLKQKNVVGNIIWEYTMAVAFCSNGSKVTSIGPAAITGKVYDWAKLSGWEYEGVRDKSQSETSGGSQWGYRTTSQGAFKFCPPPKVWCVGSDYPRITIDVYGDHDVKIQTKID